MFRTGFRRVCDVILRSVTILDFVNIEWTIKN